MAHKTETILNRVVTVLTGLTTTGSNVTRGRAWPVAQLPAVSIYMGADNTADAQNINIINRELTVFIIAHIRESGSLESTLNNIKAEVYAAIMADPTLTGLALDMYLVQDGAPEIEAEQDQPTARMTMEWRVIYRHSATSAEV